MRLPIGNINIIENAILKHNWNEETLGEAVAAFKSLPESDQNMIWYAIQNGGYNAMNHYKVDQGLWDSTYQPLVNAYMAAQNGNVSTSNPSNFTISGMDNSGFQTSSQTPTKQSLQSLMQQYYGPSASQTPTEQSLQSLMQQYYGSSADQTGSKTPTEQSLQELMQQYYGSSTEQTDGQTPQSSIIDSTTAATQDLIDSTTSKITGLTETDSAKTDSAKTGSVKTGSVKTGLTGTTALKLNNDTIRDIMSRLTLCIEELENTIKAIETGELTTINNSWIANEAKTYTNKVVVSNTKVRKVEDCLRLLENAYNTALKEALSTTEAVGSVVNNI